MEIMKFYIKMNEEKFLRDYTENTIRGLYHTIDNIMKEFDFKKNEEVTDGVEYIGDDYPKAAGVTWQLKAQDWFIPYCDKWTWYMKDDVEEESYDMLESQQSGRL